MSVLRLFDASQYIASGKQDHYYSDGVIEDHGEYRANEMPVGGVTYLLDTVNEFKNDGSELVFCFDKTPTIKREIHKKAFPMMSGYKGNRPRNARYEDMVIQRHMSEEIIKMIGLSAIAVEDVEADDCIASIVKYYKNDFEKIYVHTRDSDLYYLVCDNVEIVPVGKTGKHVTRRNWESIVKKDHVVPYNTLTLQKMIDGEPGDNIPRVAPHIKDIIMSRLPESEYERCGDNNLLRRWLERETNSDKTTMAIFDLIEPIIVPFELVEFGEPKLNYEVFKTLATKLGCWDYRGFPPVNDPDVNNLVSTYLNLYNGR